MGTGSEDNFRDLFKDNADFFFILDMDGNIIETNDAVKIILGYSNEDLLGKSVLIVHPPEFRDQAAEIVSQMLKGEKASCPIPLLTKDNNLIPVETRVFQGTWNSKKALIGVSRNMSELNISEEKFYRVFNLSHVLMSISDPNTGDFINVNKQFLKTLGYTKEEIIGKPIKNLDFFNDISQGEKAIEIFKKNGQLDNFETCIKNKNGELVYCLFSMDKIKIQSIEYIFTSATDITQQKIAEKKISFLYKQQKLIADISQLINGSRDLRLILNDVLRLIGEHTEVSRVYIFENINDGPAVRNTYEWCNTGICPQIDELQDIPANVTREWREMILKKGFFYSRNIKDLPHDIYAILKSQGIKSILNHALFVQNEFYGFIGFDECISNKNWTDEEIDLLRTVSNIISNSFDRHFVIKKLENSELRLKLAMESAGEGLWDWNNKTGYVYFSDAWCRMLGYEPEEITPNVSSWEKLVHPEDIPFVFQELNKHLKGESEHYETIHRVNTKDGKLKWILDHGMVTERDDKNLPVRTIGTHIDVTKQKETEEQLKESIETKNKLFSIIAHDLKGPIGNFIPVLELLTGGGNLDESDKKIFLEELKYASKNTLSLLDNLLNWSRSQTNSITLKSNNISINDLITENIELHSSAANIKSISISVLLDKEITAFADKESISLVIRNLLSNAIKFTDYNGKVTISARNTGDEIEIKIEDNGIGMQKEVVNNLFKTGVFFTSQGTNNEKGSGIGLLLCKDFVEKNGGKIRVESTPGKGSRFIFTVPRAR
jgi:PAS domain S-box-containing protein